MIFIKYSYKNVRFGNIKMTIKKDISDKMIMEGEIIWKMYLELRR